MMYNIIKVTTVDELLGMKTYWDGVYESNSKLSHAQSFRWNYDFLRLGFHKGSFVIYFLFKNHKLITIVPLQKHRLILSLVSDGDTHADYVGWVYRPELNSFDIEYLLQQIISDHKFSIVRFNRVNFNHNAYCEYLLQIQLAYKVEQQSCFSMKLFPSASQYVESLKKSERKKSARMIRKFNALHSYPLFRFYRGDELPRKYIPLIKHIYKERVIDITEEFRYNEDYMDWFFDYVLQSNDFLIGLMLLDNEKCLIAFELGCIRNNRIEVCMVQFDLTYREFSPGLMMLLEMVKHCTENQTIYGIDEFDLTIGDEKYKKDYGCSEHLNYSFKFNYFLQAKFAQTCYHRTIRFIKRTKSWITSRNQKAVV